MRVRLLRGSVSDVWPKVEEDIPQTL